MYEKPIIAMWSGPRNISTAMMRAFENRRDTAVWDEPFYAHYLDRTGLDHPMKREIIDAGETNLKVLIDACLTIPTKPNRHGNMPSLWFQKHMTVHMQPHIPLDWAAHTRNFFLIRRPEAVLASYHDRRANPTAEDVGFHRQAELFDLLCDIQGAPPPVIDSDTVLANPEKILKILCDALSITFDPAMLSWPAGRRDDDGIWAPHWYASVNTSTGFSAPRSPKPLPAHLMKIADQCRPHYEKIRCYAIS